MTAVGWGVVVGAGLALSVLSVMGAMPRHADKRWTFVGWGLAAYVPIAAAGLTLVFGSVGTGLGSTLASLPLALAGAAGISRRSLG